MEIEKISQGSELEGGASEMEQIDQRARGGLRVAEGAVAGVVGDAQMRAEMIEVVAAESGNQPAG